MSGIAGIFHLDGAPADPRNLRRMMDAIAHRGRDGAETWVNNHIGLGCQLLEVAPESGNETQPFTGTSNLAVVFDGRLDNRDELLDLIEPAPGITRDAPDVALVAGFYRAFGSTRLSLLKGDFAFALYDAGHHRLLLVRDVIGVRPLYYCRAGEALLFASEIKALLAHPDVTPRPNDAHLAELILGTPPAGDGGLTFFEGISTLAPAHLVSASGDGIEHRRYWDFDPSATLKLASYGEYAEGFRHHLESALRRRMRSARPVALSLSGGLDSSSLCCLMQGLSQSAPSGTPPMKAYSYFFPDGCAADEKSYVAELEQCFGFRTERIPFAPMSLLDSGTASVESTESPIPESMWRSGEAMLASAAGAGARVLISGHWADQVLYDTSYLADLFRRFRWKQLIAHVRAYPHWFSDEDAVNFRRRVRRTLIRSCIPDPVVLRLRSLRHRINRFQRNRPWFTDRFRNAGNGVRPPPAQPGASNHARSLYDTVRSRYYVLAMANADKTAARHGMTRAYPFLDRDLIGFLMAIPGEFTTHRGVPKSLLRDALGDVLPPNIAARNWKADVTSMEIDAMRNEYPRIAGFLTRDCAAVAAGYVDADTLIEELESGRQQLHGSNLEVAWATEYLVGLELWLRAFFRGRESC